VKIKKSLLNILVTIVGWELQNPFMMWCWRKPKILLKILISWLFVDDVLIIDHQYWIFVHVYVVKGWKKMLIL
jgi:hypothetical protein